MTDIVERLRGTNLSTANSDYNANIVGANMQEAADEIERLRQLIAELVKDLKDIRRYLDSPATFNFHINEIVEEALAKATGGE